MTNDLCSTPQQASTAQPIAGSVVNRTDDVTCGVKNVAGGNNDRCVRLCPTYANTLGKDSIQIPLSILTPGNYTISLRMKHYPTIVPATLYAQVDSLCPVSIGQPTATALIVTTPVWTDVDYINQDPTQKFTIPFTTTGIHTVTLFATQQSAGIQVSKLSVSLSGNPLPTSMPTPTSQPITIQPTTPPLPTVVPTVALRFSDVKPGDLGYNEIQILSTRRTKAPDSTGISGCASADAYGTSKFCPGDPVDRGAMSKFMIIAMQESVSTSPSTFTDVTPTGPYGTMIKYIMRMKEKGITVGCGTGTTFCPNETVKRVTMVTFLSRTFSDFASFTPPNTPSFVDVPKTDGNYKAVEFAKYKRITTGCYDTKHFCPNDVVSRAQMAVFLIRAFPN